MQKPVINVKSRAALGVLGLVIVCIGWLFWTANTTRAPSDNLIAVAVTSEPPARITTGDWSAPPGLATFGNEIRLLAFSLADQPFSPGSPVEVTLLWQRQRSTTTANLFLHLLDDNDAVVAQVDAPLATAVCAASSQFSAGMIVTCYPLLLPEQLAAGQYQLMVGVYSSDSGLRLTTSTGESVLPLATLEVRGRPAVSASTPLPPCPVTAPNGSTPPGEQPSPDQHGNGQIWTGLWPEGKVVFEPGGPGQILPDGSLAMKWWWWRGIEGQLTIEGRRLDAPAPPLQADIPEGYGEIGFQAAGLIFPSEGCWEVTGRVGEAELTFVTLVVQMTETH